MQQLGGPQLSDDGLQNSFLQFQLPTPIWLQLSLSVARILIVQQQADFVFTGNGIGTEAFTGSVESSLVNLICKP